MITIRGLTEDHLTEIVGLLSVVHNGDICSSAIHGFNTTNFYLMYDNLLAYSYGKRCRVVDHGGFRKCLFDPELDYRIGNGEYDIILNFEHAHMLFQLLSSCSNSEVKLLLTKHYQLASSGSHKLPTLSFIDE